MHDRDVIRRHDVIRSKCQARARYDHRRRNRRQYVQYQQRHQRQLHRRHQHKQMSMGVEQVPTGIEQEQQDPWLHVGVVITVLVDPSNSNTRLEVSQISAQHEYARLVFTGGNVDELSRFPSNAGGPAGNAKIVIEPANINDDSSTVVRYVDTASNQMLNGLTGCIDAAETVLGADAIVPNVVNIYYGQLVNGLLGEAVVTGNVMCVTSGAVGAPWRRGYGNELYNGGATFVHELGHVFGLLHTFDNLPTQCSSPLISDLPGQFTPNLSAALDYNTATKKWQLVNDNRQYDCEGVIIPDFGAPPYSCVSALGLDCGGEYTHEAGWSYMDYTADMTMIAFSSVQCSVMRASMLANEMLFVTIGGGPGDNTASLTTENSKPAWAIAVVVISAVALLTAVIVLVVLLRKK